MTAPLQYGLGGDRPYGQYYRHSGQTPVAAIALAAVAGLAVGVAAAYLYALAVRHIPVVQLRAVATAGFGALAGGVTALIAKSGKVRSTAVVLALVGVVVLVAYYFSWIFWLKMTFDRAFAGQAGYDLTHAHLVTQPALLVDVVRFINEHGTWGTGRGSRENDRGLFLALVWVAEAATIFGVAYAVALPLVKAEMFCERCARWSGSPVQLGSVGPGDPARLRQTLEAHDLSYLLTPRPADPLHFWTFEHHRCLACNDLHALSVYEHKLKADKKGAVTKTKKKVLIDKLLIDSDEADALHRPPAPVASVAPVIDVPPSPPTPS